MVLPWRSTHADRSNWVLLSITGGSVRTVSTSGTEPENRHPTDQSNWTNPLAPSPNLLRTEPDRVDLYQQPPPLFPRTERNRTEPNLPDSPPPRPCPLLLCRTKNGLARSETHRAPANRTSSGSIHMSARCADPKTR